MQLSMAIGTDQNNILSLQLFKRDFQCVSAHARPSYFFLGRIEMVKIKRCHAFVIRPKFQPADDLPM